MASTGTYAFNPAIANLTLLAFGRIQIRRSEITAQHLADADLETNFTQQAIANRQPNLWRQEIFEIELTEDDEEYDLPARMIAVRDAYIRTTISGVTTDRVVWPLSPSEYDALPDKTMSAPPQSYLVTKLMSPTVKTWPVADATDRYVLKLRLLTQIQDASLVNGTTLDMPYRALDIFVAGLAHRLARIYKPELEDKRKVDYENAWTDFANTDVEDGVPLYVSPAFNAYYRP
jgi:hypothetical protein